MDNIVCPVCGKKLNIERERAVCDERHSYDRAREGYFYLLPPNAKRSAAPGDNKDMVSARALFLATDSYAPLANRLSELISAHFPSPVSLLDAGVGTGYYLEKISAARGNKDRCVGVDISKNAVRVAARANASALLMVASVFALPIADASVDVTLSVFSPFADKEISRVLKKDGILLAAFPAEEHLIELRRALYDDVRPVQGVPTSTRLKMTDSERLTYRFTLARREEVSALLSMTPYVYRAPSDKVASVRECENMTLTADFIICTFKNM